MRDEMMMQAPLETSVQCPFCFQSFEATIDPSEGPSQQLDIDCEVCCHALFISVSIDEETGVVSASSEKAF